MELSRFFTLAELTRSDTATRENIPNQPTEAETAHLRALCLSVLDPLREAIGRAIRVNSGYRGPALNRRIRGATRSQHLEGKAADIQAPGLSVLELFKTIVRLQLPFDQLIYEAQSRTAKWVHVSHDPARARGSILIAQFGPDGRPRAYVPVTAEAALHMTEPAMRSAVPVELTYIETADEPADTRTAPRKPRSKPAPRKRPATKAKAKPAKARGQAQRRPAKPTPKPKKRVSKRKSRSTKKRA